MIDEKKIQQAVRLFLEGIGENPDRAGVLETPARVARACKEIFGGYEQKADQILLKCFDSSASDLVIEKDIQFYSMCEHHLLPFIGKAAIGYVPDGKVVGLSKLVRLVNVYARRAQIQENLTEQIADSLMAGLKAKGVIVLVQAEHMCMSMRGVNRSGVSTVTLAHRGILSQDAALRESFFERVKL
ncbi:MAG: GTP cyclohydrolase I FolE [Treponema sp.]|nr:GTP cyclohydrolase I FolE [Treponema sp.]MEE3436291.1 GTP cyclohydrolase I FolE [Treponema sp.]